MVRLKIGAALTHFKIISCETRIKQDIRYLVRVYFRSRHLEIERKFFKKIVAMSLLIWYTSNMIKVSNLEITATGNSQVRLLELSSEERPFIPDMRIEAKMNSNFLSVSQFAKEADITPQAVRKMISERRLGAEKLGEIYIIAREELDRYLCRR